jgi:Ca2+-binding RTX toxin-like protein
VVDAPATPTAKGTLTLGTAQKGTFYFCGDKDLFAVRLEQGKAYDVALVFGAWDEQVSILDAAGRKLAGDLFQSRLRFRAPATGTFLVLAEVTGDASGDYTLTVSAAKDAPPWNPGAGPTEGDDLLVLTAGPDSADALGGNDLVDGTRGNDKLGGGPGSDAVLGGPGKDEIDGGPDHDYVQGGPDDDTLRGGPGQDQHWGDEGRDVFVIDADAASEVIHDFVPGTDRIDLRAIDADKAKPGNQAFAFLGTRPATGAGQINYRREEMTGSVRIFGYTEPGDSGGPSPSFEIRLTNGAKPRAGDFLP